MTNTRLTVAVLGIAVFVLAGLQSLVLTAYASDEGAILEADMQINAGQFTFDDMDIDFPVLPVDLSLAAPLPFVGPLLPVFDPGSIVQKEIESMFAQ